MAVPPLRHRILDACKERIALRLSQRHRHREIIDDVQNSDHKDEGQVVPVRDVDMRLLAAHQRADIKQEIDNPDDHQQDVGIPFGLRIFLGLRDPHQIAGNGEYAEKVVADKDDPGT